MGGADRIGAPHVRNCTRDLQDPMVGTGRQAESVNGAGQQPRARGVGCAPVVDLAAGQQGIGLALARQLHGPCPGDPGTHGRRGFTRGSGLQFAGRQGRDFQHQVDAVQQRPGELVVVTGDLLRRAPAASVRVAMIAAGTGVHGCDQLYAGWKLGAPGRPRDGDATAFQGLPQGLQHAFLELGQFVEEQHPVVGQADLAGPGCAAAAVRSKIK